MSFTYTIIDLTSEEDEVVEIKIENCTLPEPNEDPPNTFDAAQGLEPHISSADCSSQSNSVEVSDAAVNYCDVKIEEETVQINEVTPFSCHRCNVSYDGLASYEMHLKDKHNLFNILYTDGNKNPYMIDEYTTSSFYENYKVTEQKRIHTEEKHFICDACPAIFPSTTTLKLHKKIHKRNSRHRCDECPSSFAYNFLLVKHKLSIHKGEKPHKCDECPISFKLLDSLKLHKRFHSGGKLYQCDGCPISFDKLSSMRTHRRVHTLERPHKCEKCVSSFNTTHSLRAHMRFHGEKFYKCDQCGLTYDTHKRFSLHKSSHIEKFYKCNECTSSFHRKEYLANHKKTHTRKNNNRCDECRLTFDRISSLIEHKRLTHENSFIHTTTSTSIAHSMYS